VPLTVGGARRGLVLVSSLQPDAFTPEDVRLAESIAGWVSIVVHRAELVEEIAQNAVEQGRRAVAEELITVLAHDLRNYISPIVLRLELLRRRAKGEERAADLRDIDLASRGLQRLSGIVSDILDVARIDQGVFRMDIVPVDLVALLEDVSNTLSAPDRPVCTTASEEVMVVADPARLRQCVENVISNAVNHSPKGATVTIRVARENREEGEFARVDVLDEGPGIAPDLLPKIFERFTTGGHTGNGLGLGLYLAQRIAVMHRGSLTVDSAPGKGACFTLKLPCPQEP
jgi:two-component system, OmpR family, sensor kinase